MMPPKRLFLIDGMAQIYRAHFAMIKNPLITKDGRHTSAIFGFMNSLFKLIRKENPDYIAIVLDSKEKTFRHKLYTDYKATREKMPEELVGQLEPLFRVISHTRIPMLKKSGYEADDIMGTLVKKAEKEGLQTFLVTGDKDMMQLVSDNTFMYSPGNSFKPTTIYTKEKVKDKWGVEPKSIIDMLALVGDSSDNVPGIDGVGPKTAKKLLDKYKNIESIMENSEEAKNKRVREGLKNGRDLVYLSKELVTIDCEVPIEFHLEEFIFKKMNVDALTNDFRELEMYSLINQLSVSEKLINKAVKTKKKYITIRTEAALLDLVDNIQNCNFISFDLETTSSNPLEADLVGISFSFSAHSGFYIPIQFPEKNEMDLNLNQILKYLKPEFENSKNQFCGHNIKYDLLVLSRYGIDLQTISFDTMLAEHLLHPEKNSYKLDYLSLDYLKYKMVPIENLIGSGLTQISMAEVSLEDISYYAVEDADITYQLSILLRDQLEREGLLNLYNNIELPLIKVLLDIEKNGIFLDMEYLENLSNEFAKSLSDLTDQIYSIVGKEFNINSPKQLSEILFDDLGLNQVKKRSTAVEVLKVLQQFHPLPKVILEYRHLAKLKSTYVDAFPNYKNKSTHRIHTSLNQTITSTGRLSSTKPNLQNIPIRTSTGRQLRKAFVAEKNDWLILSVDYSQIELRIMAHYSNEENLILAFREDADVHSRTAALVNNVDITEVTEEQRRAAKVVNFGIMYGAGPYRMSQELGISMFNAKELINHYFSTYPGIQRYIEETIQYARKTGFVKTLYDRKRRIENIHSENSHVVKAEERIAINMPIQGTAADLIKIAMIKIFNRINNEHFKSKMILQIHDELLFECPRTEIEEIEKIIKFEMESAIQLIVPLKVDSGYGKSWYDAH